MSPPQCNHGRLNVFKWGLSEWSNFAAVLCALDCTLLPLLTAALPFAGLVADSQHLKIVHAASQWVALYIVLPLGCFAVGSNYLQLRRAFLGLTGLAGLLLVLLAHTFGVHEHLHHVEPERLSPLGPSGGDSGLKGDSGSSSRRDEPKKDRSAFPAASWAVETLQRHHTLVSLCGAALLLTSNFLSHKMKHKLGHQHMACCGGKPSGIGQRTVSSRCRSYNKAPLGRTDCEFAVSDRSLLLQSNRLRPASRDDQI